MTDKAHWSPRVVFDIDGVLADSRHRLHLIRQKPKNWDQFYALVSQDPVLEVGKELVFGFSAVLGSGAIMYLTGRRESARQDTADWLRLNGFPGGVLCMRPDGDYRPAKEYKLENIYPPECTWLVVDDDPEVCVELLAQGYRVLQAKWAHEEWPEER